MTEASPHEAPPSNWLRRLGPLRTALILAALITVFARPETGAEVAYSGWAMVNTLLMPVLAPLLFMLLMLDALMSKVWLSEAEGGERARLRFVLRADLVTGLLLLLAWLPFFIALGD